MSEHEFEKPVPDSVDQRRDLVEQGEPPEELPSVPFDADEADAAEQHREVGLDEDDYR